MNTIHVELTGASPILHNHCWSDGSGWRPKTDLEQAESRLFARPDGSLYLPWDHPVATISRAAWSRYGWCGARWPRGLKHAGDASHDALRASDAAFAGRWTPHVFRRDGLLPVALPRFDRWTASFTLEYDPAYHHPALLRELLEHAGRHLGLPQFAPFAGPGPWGRFDVTRWEAGDICEKNWLAYCKG